MTEDVQCPQCKRKTPYIIESKSQMNDRGEYSASGHCSICSYHQIWFSYLSPVINQPANEKDED